MPAMIRPKGKSKKIAFKVLGIPANISFKPNKKQKEVNKRLVFDETTRVR